MTFKRTYARSGAFLTIGALATSLAAGCSASKTGSGYDDAGTYKGGGGGDDSGPGGFVGGGDSGGGGVLVGNDAGDNSGLLDSGCATATASATRAPVYMLIIIDGSGSMAMDRPVFPNPPTPNQKWAALVPALDAFFDDLLAKADPSFAVGLIGFSDQNDPTCGGIGCSGPYPSSADVSIASVDQAQHDKLRGRIDNSKPQGDTPTQTALQGGYGELEGYTPSGKTPPNGKKVLVLMTDGVPTDGSDVNSISSLVGQEFAKASPQGPVTTFAVGIGPFPSTSTQDYDPVFMGHIAKAGGAAPASCNQDETQNVANVCHFQVSPGNKSAQQLEQDFLAAINSIRGQVSTCDFVLDKSGGAIDPSQVNVVYTDQNGVQHTIVQDGTNGWTYDDPNNPSKVILHGKACTDVQSDIKVKISIVLGCKTVTK